MQRKERSGHSERNGGDKGIASPVTHPTQTHCASRGADLPRMEVWQADEPTTIDKLMGQNPDDPSADVDATCPFHVCLLENRTSDNGFNYMKCPTYLCVFIASQQEVHVHQYLQAVEKQWHQHLVNNTQKMHSKWPKILQ